MNNNIFHSPSTIAKVIQSARKVTGKKLFEETAMIQEGVSRNNDSLATHISQLRLKLENDASIIRRVQPVKISRQIGSRPSHTYTTNTAVGSAFGKRSSMMSKRPSVQNANTMLKPLELGTPFQRKRNTTVTRNLDTIVQTALPSGKIIEMPKTKMQANFMPILADTITRKKNPSQVLFIRQCDRTRSVSPTADMKRMAENKRKIEKKIILQRKDKLEGLIFGAQNAGTKTAMSIGKSNEISQQNDRVKAVTPIPETDNAGWPRQVDKTKVKRSRVRIPTPDSQISEFDRASMLIAEQFIVEEEVNFNTQPSDEDFFELQEKQQEPSMQIFPKPLRLKTEKNVFSQVTKLKKKTSFIQRNLAEKMKSLLSNHGSQQPSQSVWAGKKQISDSGRPLCLIGKVRKTIGKYNQTIASPHEAVADRHKDLLNLTQETDEKTDKHYFDIEFDSFYVKQKFPGHQVLVGGEVREQFNMLKTRQFQVPDEIKDQVDRAFQDVTDNNDPLMLSLAFIRYKKDHPIKKKKVVIEEIPGQQKNEKMMSLLLGENLPAPILANISKKVNKNMYKEDFKKFTGGHNIVIAGSEIDNTAKHFAQEIRDKRTFFELHRASNGPSIVTGNQNNQMFQLLQAQKQKQILALPLLFKIRNGTLLLQEYQLGPGQIDSLCEVLEQFPEILHGVHLSRNGIRDPEMAKLLYAFAGLNRLTTLVIKYNQLNQKAMEQLFPIIGRNIKKTLEELRLVKCKTTPELLGNMLDHMTQSGTYISKLGLVQTQMSGYHVEKLVGFMDVCTSLKELDLSWSNLCPSDMLALSRSLKNNRQLTWINLSWNYFTHMNKNQQSITCHQEEENEMKELQKAWHLVAGDTRAVDLSLFDKEKINHINFIKKYKVYTQLLDQREATNPMRDHNREIIRNMGHFIKRNKKLLHVNLDNTFMSEHMLFYLCASLTRSASVISLHCSGNPGITHRMKEMLWRRIRGKDPNYKVNKLDIEADWHRDMQSDKFRDQHQKETMQKRKVAPQKALDSQPGLCELNARTCHIDNRLVLTRTLQHKFDVPLCGQWKLLKDFEKCWVCDNHTYTIFFWSERSGAQQWSKYTGDGVEEALTIEKLQAINYENRHNEQIVKKMDNTPHVMCAQNNWTPTPMLPIKEYCLAIDREKPDFLADLIDRKKIPEKCDTEKKLSYQQKLLVKDEVDAFCDVNYNTYDMIARCLHTSIRERHCVKVDMEFLIDHHELFYQRQRIADFRVEKVRIKKKKLQESSEEDSEGNRFKRPLSPSEKTEKEISKVYVYACFHKPMKSTYAVLNRNEYNPDQIDYYLHKFNVPKRVDPIPPFAKKIRTVVKKRIFKRDTSIFKDWRSDNDMLYEDIATHDFEYWKVAKVCTNEEDFEEVKIVIRAYMHKLKNIFVSMASQSRFPQIGLQDFTSFCNHKLQMIDKKYLSDASLDLACVGAMTNDIRFNRELQLSGSITRFEFMEILVRAAKARYFVPQLVDTVATAVENLLDEYVVKNYKEEEWETFRKTKLWTLECSDLFSANLQGLQQVMSHYYKPRKNTFTRDDAFTLVVKDAGFEQCAAQDITYCWGMSKMTVSRENNNYYKYDDLKMVEFFEFLARLAEKRFLQPELSFIEKIELVLDKILGVVNLQRQLVNVEIEEESESDDEY